MESLLLQDIRVEAKGIDSDNNVYISISFRLNGYFWDVCIRKVKEEWKLDTLFLGNGTWHSFTWENLRDIYGEVQERIINHPSIRLHTLF